MQALAHLGATVGDQHRTVLVDVDEGAGLVERGEVERDPELHRGHRQAALGVRMRGVVCRDLGLAAPPTSPVVEHLVPAGPDPLGVPHRLAVGGGLARRRRSCGDAAPSASMPEQRRAPAEDVLDDEHALRARRSHGTRSGTSCGSWRSGRSPGRWGSSRRCRCGTGRGPAPARTGPGSSRRRRSAWRRAPAAARRRRSRPATAAWNPCRLPDIVMSWVRLSRNRTGRPVRVAPRAAIAA